MLRAREDFQPVTIFYNSFLTSNKGPHISQLLTQVLHFINFSVRKNTISQKIHYEWREMAITDSNQIRNLFKEKNVEIVIDFGQSFIQFNPEAQYLIAPKGARRIDRKMKMAGFKIMVGVDLISSMMLDPFIVFNGTKKNCAVHLEQTLWYKYLN